MKKTIATLFAILIAAPAFAQTVPQWGFNASPRQLLYRGSGMTSFEPLNAAPHVATNAALAASKTVAYPTGVWRDDYAAGAGASPLWFTPLTGTCAANSLVNDGGYCVNTTSGDGNSWRAWHPPEGVSPVQFGADPTGTADSISAIVAAISSGNRKILFPCGTYSIGGTIQTQSKTELAGNGPCSVIQMRTGMLPNPQLVYVADPPPGIASNKTMISNADFQLGNTEIKVHDLTVSMAGITEANVVWAAFFYKQTKVYFDKVRFIGSNNIAQSGGFGILDSSLGYANNSYFENLAGGGACVSTWDGTHDFQARGNYCEGSTRLHWGIQANAVSSSGNNARTGYNITFTDNIVKNVTVAGIDLDGLCGAALCGTLDRIVATGNIVDTSGNLGFRVGHGANMVVSGNVIKTAVNQCMIINSSTFVVPQTTNIIATNNTMENCLTSAAAGLAAISVGNGADTPDHIELTGNQVFGATHPYAMRIYSGTNIRVIPGYMAPGTTGTLLDGGTNTIKIGTGADLLPFASTSTTTWKDTGSGNTVTCGISATFPICNASIGMTWQIASANRFQFGANVDTAFVPLVVPHYSAAGTPIPACSATYKYAKAYVDDATQTLTAGIGAVYASGGANIVPVGCDGTNWRIGG